MSNSSHYSASTSLFQDSAEQLAARLEQETSDGALTLAREARELAARFGEWKHQRPADDVRVATIQRLFEVNRQAMDLLAR